MNNRTGVFGIYALVALFAALHLGLSAPEAGLKAQIGTLIGGIAFLLMATAIFLATRPRFLENAFGGLDRMYKAHKMSGAVAGLLILVHFFAIPKELPAGVDALLNPLVPSAPLGMITMILLIISLAITLNRKIAYHRWRVPHKLMGVVFILATGHFLTTPAVFVEKFGPSSFLLMAAAILGVLAYFYSLFGLSRRASTRFVVEAVNHLERATEIVLKPLAEKLDFQPGQFAFVQINAKGFDEPHPFTIASAPGEDKLRFTIKVLGDWTRKIREELEPGVETTIHGPYGRFSSANAGNKQVWLAGGIGITPFLSTLRAMQPDDPRQITLVYAARDKNEAVFLEEIQRKAQTLGNVKVVVLESNEGQFARVDIMKTKLADPLKTYDFFLCGPKPMVEGLSRGLRKEGVGKASIHTEAFEFR